MPETEKVAAGPRRLLRETVAVVPITHAENPLGGDYTLCGFSSDGETGSSFMEKVIGNAQINCPECLKIIQYCKSIPRCRIQSQSTGGVE